MLFPTKGYGLGVCDEKPQANPGIHHLKKPDKERKTEYENENESSRGKARGDGTVPGRLRH